MPAPAASELFATRIALRFDTTAPLPGGDGRPTGGKLSLLEVVPGLPTHTFDFSTPGAMRLAATGIDQDGWMVRKTSLELPASPTATDVTMRIEFPDWGDKKSVTLHAQFADATAVGAQTLHPGEYATFHFRVPASTEPRSLQLDTPAEFPLPAPDSRVRAARLLQVDLAPAA